MIELKNAKQLEHMRAAGRLTYETIAYLADFIKPGITTGELDRLAHEYVTAHGGKPSFLHLYGFPASICASIDEEVVHGIPSQDRMLEEGQILSIDFGACVEGYHGDMARTYAVGQIDREKERLIRVTEEAFWQGAALIRPGVNLREISKAIQDYAEARGYGVVRDLTGHGIGRKMHEDPTIPNFDCGVSVVLKEGMTLAIEPMITAGGYEVDIDGWHITTRDGLPASHYENTVAVTATGYEVLTKGDIHA